MASGVGRRESGELGARAELGDAGEVGASHKYSAKDDRDGSADEASTDLCEMRRSTLVGDECIKMRSVQARPAGRCSRPSSTKPRQRSSSGSGHRECGSTP